MRIGNNPLRAKMTSGLQGRIASVITHLPNQEGYHKRRLEVIQACLLSMRNGAPGIPVIVWDNGSCDALVDWLRKEYQPHTLILSSNVGKSNARASLFGMVRQDAIMSLCDDDMLFYPGWWDASMKLMKTFPQVGRVSCYPVRTQARWGCWNTKAWAREFNEKYEVGKFISEEEDYDFCMSIGRDYEYQKEYTANDKDYVVTYKGEQAYCFAHHCQFMAIVGVIEPFCQRNDHCMADEKPFDNAIDTAGLLNLTTRQRYARHIGNIVDQKVAKELRGMGVTLQGEKS